MTVHWKLGPRVIGAARTRPLSGQHAVFPVTTAQQILTVVSRQRAPGKTGLLTPVSKQRVPLPWTAPKIIRRKPIKIEGFCGRDGRLGGSPSGWLGHPAANGGTARSAADAHRAIACGPSA